MIRLVQIAVPVYVFYLLAPAIVNFYETISTVSAALVP